MYSRKVYLLRAVNERESLTQVLDEYLAPKCLALFRGRRFDPWKLVYVLPLIVIVGAWLLRRVYVVKQRGDPSSVQ